MSTFTPFLQRRTLALVTLFVFACSDKSTDNAIPDGGDISVDSALPPDAAVATDYAVTEIAPNCIDMAGATEIPLDGLIHATSPIDLPFAFPLYGKNMTRVSVIEQGQLLLFDDNEVNITTLVPVVEIPSSEKPNAFVAPLWTTKLSFVPRRSKVRAGTPNATTAIVEWHDFAIGNILADATSHLTFQAKLFANGIVEFHYCTLDPGRTTTGDHVGERASIGIESAAGDRGKAWSFFKPNAIATDKALRFSPQ